MAAKKPGAGEAAAAPDTEADRDDLPPPTTYFGPTPKLWSTAFQGGTIERCKDSHPSHSTFRHGP